MASVNQFNGPMVKMPCIEWQAWLVSVILHGVIVTAVVVLARGLVIEATEPFRLELTVVEREKPAPAAAETVMAGSASQKLLDREPPPRSSRSPIGDLREPSRRHAQARDIVEPVTPIRRQVLESKFMNREVKYQHDPSIFERQDFIRAEQDHAVVRQLNEQPEAVDSDVPAAVVSQIVDHKVTTVEPTARSTEIRSRSVQEAANPMPVSGVNVGGSEMEKHVMQAVPDAVGGPSYAPPSTADSTSASDVHLNHPENDKQLLQTALGTEDSSPTPSTGAVDPVPALDRTANAPTNEHPITQTISPTAEGPSDRAMVSSSKEMGPSTMHGREKEASALNAPGGKSAGPDYGWLKRLLWERINRIKHYSDEALMHEWEGRVVMVVTVRSDGRIEEVQVAESSGNRSLDREAENLITRASPLELDRALGAARVKLRVPISFGLE